MKALPNMLCGLLAAAAALFIPACGPRFTNANIAVINQQFEKSEEAARKGLREGVVTPKEVESILGPPQHTENYHLALETQKKELDGVRYYYQQDGETLVLHFLDNKLISKAPTLGEKSADAPIGTLKK